MGEKSDWRRVLSIGMGFLGVLIIVFFENKSGGQILGLFSLHPGILFLLFGAILFATSDIINKKMIASESLISLLFYFYLGTALISFIPALLVWQPMEFRDISCLMLLGIGGVSILYCILKAAHATEISSIAPYKYIELVFSISFGYFLFNEVIKVSTIIGVCLIIPSALLIAYYEINKERETKVVQRTNTSSLVLEVE